MLLYCSSCVGWLRMRTGLLGRAAPRCTRWKDQIAKPAGAGLVRPAGRLITAGKVK